MLKRTPRLPARTAPQHSVVRYTQPPTSPAPIPPPVPHYVIPGSHLLDPPYNQMDNPPDWTAPAPGTPGADVGVEEAPMDGLVYGRQSAGWTEIPPPVGDVMGEWQVITQTTASDPGNGHVKFNTAAQGDATQIYLSERTVTGTDIATWMAQDPIKIFIQRKNDASRVARWNITSITNNTTWYALAVAPDGAASGFPLSGNDAVLVLLRW